MFIISIHSIIYIYIRIYIYMIIHTHTYIYVYIYICVYICMCMCVCSRFFGRSKHVAKPSYVLIIIFHEKAV